MSEESDTNGPLRKRIKTEELEGINVIPQDKLAYQQAEVHSQVSATHFKLEDHEQPTKSPTMAEVTETVAAIPIPTPQQAAASASLAKSDIPSAMPQLIPQQVPVVVAQPPSLSASTIPPVPPLPMQTHEYTHPPPQQRTPSKSREMRLEQNRKAARESRRRKKQMVEELQRSVIFFSRANAFLKQQNDEYTRMLVQAQSVVQASLQKNNGISEGHAQQQTQQASTETKPDTSPSVSAPSNNTSEVNQENKALETQIPSPPVLTTSTTSVSDQAAQAQAVARAAAQQFAPQFAAMFGPSTQQAPPSQTTSPLQVAAANFQAAAAASLAQAANAFPGVDAFQTALFQQQQAVGLSMNFGGPFQQAALAQHFSQNMTNMNIHNGQNIQTSASTTNTQMKEESNGVTDHQTTQTATS